jgi:hypothetical protein
VKSCECGYEPPGSIKCWGTIEWLHNWGASRIVLSSIEFVKGDRYCSFCLPFLTSFGGQCDIIVYHQILLPPQCAALPYLRGRAPEVTAGVKSPSFSQQSYSFRELRFTRGDWQLF